MSSADGAKKEVYICVIHNHVCMYNCICIITVYVLEPLPATYFTVNKITAPNNRLGSHRLPCWRPFWMTPKDSPWFPQLNHSFKSHSRAYGLRQRKHHARCPVQSASVMLQAPVQLLQALQQQLQELALARLKAWKFEHVGIFWRGSYNLGTPGWMKLQYYTLLAFEMIHNSSQAEYINIDFRMERRVRFFQILWRHCKVAIPHKHEN